MSDPDASTELFSALDNDKPTKTYHWMRNIFWVLVGLSSGIGCLVIGFMWNPNYPKEKTVEQEVIKTEPYPPEKFTVEVEKITSLKLQQHLSGLAGVLIVKDGVAQTALHKRAAIGSKSGYKDLPDGSYSIHSYCIHEDAGYGISMNRDNQLFAVIWLPGSIKPPQKHPEKITVLNRNIQF